MGPRSALLVLLALPAAAQTGAARAHTVWADGSAVPDWVRDACCTGAEVHRLRPDQVQVTPDGYRIEGIVRPVPFAKTYTSQDGDTWIFYRDFPDGTQYVFCLFVPPTGS